MKHIPKQAHWQHILKPSSIFPLNLRLPTTPIAPLTLLVSSPVSIIKTFHYMGFEMVKPGNPMVPARPDLAFMVYSLDNSSSDEDWLPHHLLTPPSPTLTHLPSLPPHRKTRLLPDFLQVSLWQTPPLPQTSFITDWEVSPFLFFLIDLWFKGAFGSGRISMWRRHPCLPLFPSPSEDNCSSEKQGAA